MPRQTSFEKTKALLTQHGWEFTVEPTEIKVPDYDSPDVIRAPFSGRITYAATKRVQGFKIVARNGLTGFPGENHWLGGPERLTVCFDEQGRYLPDYTTGGYPATKGCSLSDVHTFIESKSCATIEARIAQREAEQKADWAKEEAQVAEAYAEALQAQNASKAALVELLDWLALGNDQIEAVLTEAEKAEGLFATHLANLARVGTVGRGILPGKSWVSGTYVDGKRVERTG